MSDIRAGSRTLNEVPSACGSGHVIFRARYSPHGDSRSTRMVPGLQQAVCKPLIRIRNRLTLHSRIQTALPSSSLSRVPRIEDLIVFRNVLSRGTPDSTLATCRDLFGLKHLEYLFDAFYPLFGGLSIFRR
jgi:hypothetical protein